MITTADRYHTHVIFLDAWLCFLEMGTIDVDKRGAFIVISATHGSGVKKGTNVKLGASWFCKGVSGYWRQDLSMACYSIPPWYLLYVIYIKRSCMLCVNTIDKEQFRFVKYLLNTLTNLLFAHYAPLRNVCFEEYRKNCSHLQLLALHLMVLSSLT